MSIQVLSAEVVNQIAAGEVVERPAHLVKELIENSLDSKASLIHIEISHGGRSVRISDNGQGILSSDLELALKSHATSKINSSDDLWNLHTFGFRGEALASIAAVSMLSLESIHHEEKVPSQIISQHGQLSKVKPGSRRQGTEVKIDQLFENVPARLKFLKSESSESQQIKQIIKASALSHPEVEFKLIQDGELQLYFRPQPNLLLRAQDVLEKKELFTSSLNKGSFSADVVFAAPNEVAKTSRQIWIFAQGRFIQDRALHAAVMDAYRSLLMHGEYPIAVIKLHCEPSEIDVNIHPTKSQVKFQDSAGAFRCVHLALRQALELAPWIPKIENRNSDYNSAVSSEGISGSLPEDLRPDLQKTVAHYSQTQSSSRPLNLTFHDQSFWQTQFKKKEFDITKLNELRVNPEGYWSSLQILGQANLTYILCQKEDRLVYVDQHAAHERVVYESLMQSWKNKKFDIQEFLFPFVIDLSEDKIEALFNIESAITELGIHIERLGPISLGIKAAPNLIKESALPYLFEKMSLELQENGGSFAIEKKVSDLFATMACHSVVRAGQSLSHPQMSELLASMDQFALSSFCPHGRPVSVETSFVELEKLFGRIN